MSTDLEKLLDTYPDKPWDWEKLSKNPNISINFIGFLFVEVALNTNFFSQTLLEVNRPQKGWLYKQH